jgi:hypothetical protein
MPGRPKLRDRFVDYTLYLGFNVFGMEKMNLHIAILLDLYESLFFIGGNLDTYNVS